MKTISLIILTALAAAGGLSAAETNGVRSGTPVRADYSSFAIVSERNIFNPHRSKRSGDRPPPRTEPEKRVKMDRFALLGTMSYEKGRYAFFDGSSSDFRKVAKPEDSIAGFKIAEVAPTCVKLLLTNGTLLELCVGMQMKKSEDSDWQLAGKADSAEGSGTNASGSSGSASSGSSAPESDDVLKRLLAKREQEGAPAVTPAPAAAPPKIEEPRAAVAAPGEADEVLRKLLQKREQELNK